MTKLKKIKLLAASIGVAAALVMGLPGCSHSKTSGGSFMPLEGLPTLGFGDGPPPQSEPEVDASGKLVQE